GEAAVGYFGDLRGPGRAGRAATWGVRLGWLTQTALLAVQATRDNGFPWGTWASSLDLFVWLVVSAYLIWGCRRRYRLLGLVVMPLAVALLAVSRAGGGTGSGTASHYSNLFLVVHVGLVLAAFAGFTLAAALSGLYIWQERRLSTRQAQILRRQLQAMATLASIALLKVTGWGSLPSPRAGGAALASGARPRRRGGTGGAARGGGTRGGLPLDVQPHRDLRRRACCGTGRAGCGRGACRARTGGRAGPLSAAGQGRG